MIPSLEGWPNKAKEAPPHEVRLTPLDTNPVFLCLGENRIFAICNGSIEIYRLFSEISYLNSVTKFIKYQTITD